MPDRTIQLVECCETCRFYKPDPRPEYAEINGSCHRFPPILVWGNGDYGQDSPFMAATDWCGEHRYGDHP